MRTLDRHGNTPAHEAGITDKGDGNNECGYGV